MCKVLLWIFPNILGNCQKNNKVQQIAAVASDIASAAYTPATPIKCGNINANGINRIALRNKAMKIEIFACPKATNIFWLSLIHISEPTRLGMISYAVFCLKKKKKKKKNNKSQTTKEHNI